MMIGDVFFLVALGVLGGVGWILHADSGDTRGTSASTVRRRVQ